MCYVYVLYYNVGREDIVHVLLNMILRKFIKWWKINLYIHLLSPLPGEARDGGLRVGVHRGQAAPVAPLLPHHGPHRLHRSLVGGGHLHTSSNQERIDFNNHVTQFIKSK